MTAYRELIERLEAWSEKPDEGDPIIDMLVEDCRAAAKAIRALEAQSKDKEEGE